MARMLLLRSVTCLLLLITTACSQTEQAQQVKFSGFLSDYSKLGPGGPGDPLFIYINPAVDFRGYPKAMVEPVTIWRSQDADPGSVSPRELSHLATSLEAWIYKALRREGITPVQEPGPGVMRIRAGLTEAQQSSVKMDLLTSFIPLPSTSKLATGTRAFVGKASIEGEMTDSQTGELLGAMVDRRAGSRMPQRHDNSWHDVEQAFRFWSDRFAYRLCRLRGSGYCVQP